MFPVVFHPVAPPKSIALDSGKEENIDTLFIKTLEALSLTSAKADFVLLCCVSFRAQAFHRCECNYEVQ
jgi:hypothetical protein